MKNITMTNVLLCGNTIKDTKNGVRMSVKTTIDAKKEKDLFLTVFASGDAAKKVKEWQSSGLPKGVNIFGSLTDVSCYNNNPNVVVNISDSSQIEKARGIQNSRVIMHVTNARIGKDLYFNAAETFAAANIAVDMKYDPTTKKADAAWMDLKFISGMAKLVKSLKLGKGSQISFCGALEDYEIYNGTLKLNINCLEVDAISSGEKKKEKNGINTSSSKSEEIDLSDIEIDKPSVERDEKPQTYSTADVDDLFSDMGF